MCTQTYLVTKQMYPWRKQDPRKIQELLAITQAHTKELFYALMNVLLPSSTDHCFSSQSDANHHSPQPLHKHMHTHPYSLHTLVTWKECGLWNQVHPRSNPFSVTLKLTNEVQGHLYSSIPSLRENLVWFGLVLFGNFRQE